MTKETKPKFVQIVAAPWDNTFSVLALGDDGNVYRFEKAMGGWTMFSSRVLSKREETAEKIRRRNARNEDTSF